MDEKFPDPAPRPRVIFFLLCLGAILLALGVFQLWRGSEGGGESRSDYLASGGDRKDGGPFRALLVGGEGGGDVVVAEEASIDAPVKGEIRRERILRFDDEATYRRVLQELEGFSRAAFEADDRLRAIRIRLGREVSDRDLADLLPEGVSIERNIRMGIPPGAVASGGRPVEQPLMEWMGVEGFPDLGKGVRVAIVDGPYRGHESLAEASVEARNRTGENDTAYVAGEQHAVSVTSLVSGIDALGRGLGLAPGADLLVLSALDDQGMGNSFQVARAVHDAVDWGASVINLSLGGDGDSPILREAIARATGEGVVVIAATGNDGQGLLRFPAAYEGVVAVGASDAVGEWSDFSNFGDGIDLLAPGVGLLASYGEDRYHYAYGTSMSAPVVTGALAALLSREPDLTAREGMELLRAYANETGPPGEDPYSGVGVVNLRRVFERNEPGIVDAAVAGVFPLPGGNPGEYTVTVENRGTTPLGTFSLVVDDGPMEQRLALAGLAPGEIESVVFSLAQSGPEPIRVRLELGAQEDVRPVDNQLETKISAVGEGSP